MQVILLERIVNLGQLGDVVKVKEGYARNFLIPQGKARRATDTAIKEFESRRADLEKAQADRLSAAQSVGEKLNGTAVDPAATYRVATNSFLAGGGDGFTTLGQGTNDLVGGDDLAALVEYLTANSSAGSPIAPPAANRITVVQ